MLFVVFRSLSQNVPLGAPKKIWQTLVFKKRVIFFSGTKAYCFRATIYRFCCLFTRSVSYSKGPHASLSGLLWPLFILADGLSPFYTFSFSLFIYQKKKHKNQQVLFKSGESAKVLCNVPWSYCLLGMSSLIKPSISGVAVSLSGL